MVESGDHVRKPKQIASELDSAMPGLECECRAPHQPEIRLKERRVELIGDGAPAEHSLRFRCQTLQIKDVLFAQAKFGAVDSLSSAHETGLRGGLHGLVPVEDFLSDGLASIQRRNR